MPDGTKRRTAPSPTEWGPIVDRALAGDRTAYASLARLVTGHLAHWRAYDFRADWDDMVQDVLISVVSAYREGRLEAPGALQAYLRQATRFKFIDRIRASQHRTPSMDPEDLEDGLVDGAAWPPNRSIAADAVEMRIALAQAVEELPDRERLAVLEIHLHGRTYDEAAEITGIPLGSLKRALRAGLAQLRRRLDA